jgi:hypothetical protein
LPCTRARRIGTLRQVRKSKDEQTGVLTFSFFPRFQSGSTRQPLPRPPALFWPPAASSGGRSLRLLLVRATLLVEYLRRLFSPCLLSAYTSRSWAPASPARCQRPTPPFLNILSSVSTHRSAAKSLRPPAHPSYCTRRSRPPSPSAFRPYWLYTATREAASHLDVAGYHGCFLPFIALRFPTATLFFFVVSSQRRRRILRRSIRPRSRRRWGVERVPSSSPLPGLVVGRRQSGTRAVRKASAIVFRPRGALCGLQAGAGSSRGIERNRSQRHKVR